jgi:DNA-binding MarR family transcriptional regulator
VPTTLTDYRLLDSLVTKLLMPRRSRGELIQEIVGRLARRHSTAAVLFHHVVAERLGLGPTDHKCLDLIREHGAMSASELVAITGLTSGAITGVVARLEAAGYLRREADPNDGRRQILRPVADRASAVHSLIGPVREVLSVLLKGFDDHQLTAVAAFLSHATEAIHRQMALLRGQKLLEPKAAAHGAQPGSRSSGGRRAWSHASR